MKEQLFIIEMAIRIKETIDNALPELVELKCQGTLTSTVNCLCKNKIITSEQFDKMHDEINELFK